MNEYRTDRSIVLSGGPNPEVKVNHLLDRLGRPDHPTAAAAAAAAAAPFEV
jgi:hypothetical protein